MPQLSGPGFYRVSGCRPLRQVYARPCASLGLRPPRASCPWPTLYGDLAKAGLIFGGRYPAGMLNCLLHRNSMVRTTYVRLKYCVAGHGHVWVQLISAGPAGSSPHSDTSVWSPMQVSPSSARAARRAKERVPREGRARAGVVADVAVRLANK